MLMGVELVYELGSKLKKYRLLSGEQEYRFYLVVVLAPGLYCCHYTNLYSKAT